MNNVLKGVYCKCCNEELYDDAHSKPHKCGELYFVCPVDANQYLPEDSRYVGIFSYGVAPVAESYVSSNDYLLNEMAVGEIVKLKVCSADESLIVYISEREDPADGEPFFVEIAGEFEGSGHPYFEKMRLNTIDECFAKFSKLAVSCGTPLEVDETMRMREYLITGEMPEG